MSASNTKSTASEVASQPASSAAAEPSSQSISRSSELSSASTSLELGTSSQIPATTITSTPSGLAATTLTVIASETSGTRSPSPTASTSAPATQSPSPTELSTGAIAGIAVGSIIAILIFATLLLFALGFRVNRAKWRSGITTTGVENDRGEAATEGSPGGQRGKAELEDQEYTRRLERLHNGRKPELEGKAGWRALSIRFTRKRGPQPVPAELGTDPVTPGLHELPADNGIPQRIAVHTERSEGET